MVCPYFIPEEPRIHREQEFFRSLLVGGTERNLTGGKLAYRLLREVGGHWVWTSDRLVTDNPQGGERLEAIVHSLWRDQPDTYKDLRGLRRDESWRPNPQVRADFVARGLFRDIYADIRNALATHEHDLGSAVLRGFMRCADG